MRRFQFSLFIFLLLSFSPLLRGQSAPATRQITLGNATVPLDGLWKFHIGDSPQATGTKGMAWAQPGFDDSAWGTMDLTPLQNSYDPFYGDIGYVPGWTAQGYKGYHGFAWYRLKVIVQDGQTALALQMPTDFDDAYQVYVNGRFIGQTGQFTSDSVTGYFSTPAAFPLPADLRDGPVRIAVRTWMKPYTTAPDPGGLHGPPVLGHASAIAGLLQLAWDALDRAMFGSFIVIAILLLALGVAFGLFWLDRTEPAYLWLGLTCAALLAFEALTVLGYYTTWISEVPAFLLQDAFLTPVSIGLWVLFWAYWFRLDRMAHLHRAVWALVVLLAIGMAMMRGPLYGGVVPVNAIAWLSPLTLVLKLLLGVLLVWVTVRGIRRTRFEGLLALPAVVLVVPSIYFTELLTAHVPVYYFPFGFGIELAHIATMLSLVIITVLLLRRFLRGQREREQFKLEMEQARQVQSLLVPVTAPPTPGFAVESVYLPAQQVGGDLFHLRPGEDGSLLIVVGDVSGKGLKAAMTVSTIVGALRNERSRQPAEILASLNRVLHGEITGFVTCCATLITAEGVMTISNAGHLSPYRNGEELIVPGGLPLGMLVDAPHSESHYQLAPGDRLTFMSDGVVEARNPNGDLYGFERTQSISTQPAAEIAEAAKNFGQEDDITVLTVEFAGATPPAALRGEAVLA